jgi:hypothetical protein
MVPSKLTDASEAALLIAARSGGVDGVGEDVAVIVTVPDAVWEGVVEAVGVDDGLTSDVGEGVGVRDGVMDADAPKDKDGVGVADGVVVGVGVWEGATATLNELEESV